MSAGLSPGTWPGAVPSAGVRTLRRRGAGLGQRAAAELVGAFALVFVGAGSVAVATQADAGLVAVALAHGLVIAVMASAAGHISGGHFNPRSRSASW